MSSKKNTKNNNDFSHQYKKNPKYEEMRTLIMKAIEYNPKPTAGSENETLTVFYSELDKLSDRCLDYEIIMRIFDGIYTKLHVNRGIEPEIVNRMIMLIGLLNIDHIL